MATELSVKDLQERTNELVKIMATFHTFSKQYSFINEYNIKFELSIENLLNTKETFREDVLCEFFENVVCGPLHKTKINISFNYYKYVKDNITRSPIMIIKEVLEQINKEFLEKVGELNADVN